jgi:hypothetical protein
MKRNGLKAAAEPANNGSSQAPAEALEFLNERQLLARVPISPRSLRNWRSRKVIPFIRPPGSRRILFHWPSVESSLRRQQVGVVSEAA